MEIVNRAAKFNYFIDDEYECGIVLLGTEIKAIRNSHCSIKDSYVRIKNNEAYIINMYIEKDENANIFNHDEYRERKLLLHKKEIIKLKQKVTEAGYTLVPLKIYFKDNHIKLLIGVGKGKKNYDKRETIKKRDLDRANKI